eukprot:411731-Prymnesium_polylepis.1
MLTNLIFFNGTKTVDCAITSSICPQELNSCNGTALCKTRSSATETAWTQGPSPVPGGERAQGADLGAGAAAALSNGGGEEVRQFARGAGAADTGAAGRCAVGACAADTGTADVGELCRSNATLEWEWPTDLRAGLAACFANANTLIVTQTAILWARAAVQHHALGQTSGAHEAHEFLVALPLGTRAAALLTCVAKA